MKISKQLTMIITENSNKHDISVTKKIFNIVIFYYYTLGQLILIFRITEISQVYVRFMTFDLILKINKAHQNY